MNRTIVDRIFFVGIVSVLLLLHIVAFFFVSNRDQSLGESLCRLLGLAAISLPFSILLTWADSCVLRLTRQWLPNAQITVRIALDVLITTFISVVIFYLGLFTAKFVSVFSGNVSDIPPFPVAIFNLSIVFILEALSAQRQRYEAERRINMLQREKAEYQLRTLKGQMNPHFLFNCFNALASLTRQDGERANCFVKRLAGVYRYLLTTQHDALVPLDEELAFVRSFFELEQIRLGDSLTLSVTGEEYVSQWQVVPASLQTAVENAIKHNVCNPRLPLAISIAVSPGRIIVTNPLQLRSSLSGSNGIGLQNLRHQCSLQGIGMKWYNDGSVFFVEYIITGHSGN